MANGNSITFGYNLPRAIVHKASNDLYLRAETCKIKSLSRKRFNVWNNPHQPISTKNCAAFETVLA